MEIPSEHIITWRNSYQLSLEIYTEDADLSGNPIEGTYQTADWIVTLSPEKAE